MKNLILTPLVCITYLKSIYVIIYILLSSQIQAENPFLQTGPWYQFAMAAVCMCVYSKRLINNFDISHLPK